MWSSKSLTDPVFEKLVTQRIVDPLQRSIERKSLIVSPQNSYVFLCGASIEAETSIRREIYSYMRTNWSDRYFAFLAEAYDAGVAPTAHDSLLTMEVYLAAVADCIILINESTSAAAELGVFSTDQNIVKKMIVVNDIAHQSQRSFINLGPLRHLSSRSTFDNPVVWANPNSTMYILSELRQRLSSLPAERGKAYKSNVELRKPNHRHKIALLIDLVILLQPATVDTICKYSSVVLNCSMSQVNDYITVLRSIGAIFTAQNDGHQLLSITNEFLRYQTKSAGLDYATMRARIYNYHHTRGS